MLQRIRYPDFDKMYVQEQQIGRGSYGKVYRIKQLKTNKIFALKVLNLSNQTEINDAMREIQILDMLNHPLVIKIYGYYEVKINKPSCFRSSQILEIGMILELGKCSLQELIENQQQKFSQQILWKFIIQFIKLFAWLQQQNIFHRDIKPANIIIFGDNLQCKLTDFGLCKKGTSKNNEIVGSLHYASPKLRRKIKTKDYSIQTNPIKDDVYSFGITILELVMNKIGEEFGHRTFQKILNITGKKRIPIVVELMCEYQQQKRLTFKELLNYLDSQKLIREQNQQETYERQIQRSIERSKSQHEDIREISFASRKATEKYRQFQPIIENEIKIKGSIMSIAQIGGNIMCGLDNGQIKILNGKFEQISLGKAHHKFVSFLQSDEGKNIWSAGGDNFIIKWNKKKILHALKYKIEIQQIMSQNIFQKKPFLKQKKNILKITQEEIQKIQIPENSTGVSAMYIKNQNNFVIGYYDGYIYGKWNSIQINKQLMHNSSVTCLKIEENVLYASGSDGTLKQLKLNNFSDCLQLRQIEQPIIHFQLSTIEQKQSQQSLLKRSIQLITTSGHAELIDYTGQVKDQKKLKTSNILGIRLINRVLYAISSTGDLIRNDENYQKTRRIDNTQGWNCLAPFGKKSVVLGSFQGKILILNW